MMNTALLVVDVQLGLFMRKHHDGVAIYRENTLLDNIRSLIQRARAAHAPVIFIQHMYTDFPPMAKGQPLWAFHPDIAPDPGDIVIEKYHADAFYETSLEDTLKNLSVTNLVITGVQTEYCVDTTCRRAHSLGYKTVLVSDGHSTLSGGILTAEQIISHHNSVLGSQFAILAETADIAFTRK